MQLSFCILQCFVLSVVQRNRGRTRWAEPTLQVEDFFDGGAGVDAGDNERLQRVVAHDGAVAGGREGTIEEPLLAAGLNAIGDGDIAADKIAIFADREPPPGERPREATGVEVDPEGRIEITPGCGCVQSELVVIGPQLAVRVFAAPFGQSGGDDVGSGAAFGGEAAVASVTRGVERDSVGQWQRAGVAQLRGFGVLPEDCVGEEEKAVALGEEHLAVQTPRRLVGITVFGCGPLAGASGLYCERELDFEIVECFAGLPTHRLPCAFGRDELLTVDSRLPGPTAREQLCGGGGQYDLDISGAEIDEQVIVWRLFRSPQQRRAGIGVVVAGPAAEIEESGEVAVAAGVVGTKHVRRSEVWGLVTRSMTATKLSGGVSHSWIGKRTYIISA
jgi:hypothetical protein